MRFGDERFRDLGFEIRGPAWRPAGEREVLEYFVEWHAPFYGFMVRKLGLLSMI